MKCQKRLPLLLGKWDSVNWYVTPLSSCTRKNPYLLTKLLSVCQKEEDRPYHDTKCWLACTLLLLRLGHAVLFSYLPLHDLIFCRDVSDDHTFSVSLKPPLNTSSLPGGALKLSEISVERKWARLALLSSRMMNLSQFPILWSLLSTLRLIPVLFFSLRLSLVPPFIEFLRRMYEFSLF